MGNDSEPSGIRVEPDILVQGPVEPDVSSTRAGRPRRSVRSGLLVIGVAAALVASHVIDGAGSPFATRVTPPPASDTAELPAARPVPVAPPSLIAPQAAIAGERITVLGYRNGRLCGPAELRFDGTPVAHRLVAYAGPSNPDHMQVFLTMQVPRSAAPGSHEIELYGPVPGGGPGPVCASVREHQAELSTTTIAVRSAGGPATSRVRW